MEDIQAEQALYMMYACIFFAVNIMITVCALSEESDQDDVIHYDIESPSTRSRRQYEYMYHIAYESDIKCNDKLHMDRRCFHRLCQLLTSNGGLRGTRNVMVEEMIAMFLNIVAHHVKNRIIKFDFVRSAETVSRHFHAVLKSIILCHSVLLKKPEPVPENSNDHRWKWFKVPSNCIN